METASDFSVSIGIPESTSPSAGTAPVMGCACPAPLPAAAVSPEFPLSAVSIF